ncbi:cytochrome c biogenesis protein/redoxin [Romboutsia sp. Marseille-P6047]|uniref:cytochrome c biogenesis protein/redoxin n=1 Tax=Romboutsia sp. Marseille-P6047 TaxID=2161817 RepID=UPI002ECFBB64
MYKSDLFKNTFFFIIGISTTFFILGSSVSVLSSFLKTNKDLIMTLGGLIIVFMGLFYMGIIKSKLLNSEKRFNMNTKEINIVTAFLLGFTFSFGWTPCIGPILASVLIISSSSNSFLVSNLLVLVYTIGFVFPFILVALFYNKLFNTINSIKKYMGKIKIIGGIIIILSGLAMFSSGLERAINNFNLQTKSQAQRNENIENEENQSSKKIKALDFELYDQYGEIHKLSDYKGKIIFFNIWATWCPQCREEMPYIEELYKEYNENKEDIIILELASPNIGREGDVEHIKDFLKEEGYTFPVVLDESGSQIYQYGINSFPSTLIIDEYGYITKYVPGAMNKETMKYIIESCK